MSDIVDKAREVYTFLKYEKGETHPVTQLARRVWFYVYENKKVV